MKKVCLLTFSLVLLCVLATAGIYSNSTSNTAIKVSDLSKTGANDAQLMTASNVSQPQAEVAQRAIVNADSRLTAETKSRAVKAEKPAPVRSTRFLKSPAQPARDTLELLCPVGSIFDQHPVGYDNAYTSDLWWGFKIYDEVDVYGEVCDLHFWGLKAKPGAWTTCDDEFTFEIKFYPDDGTGIPDTANPTCSYVLPIPSIDTGEMFSTFPIYRWDVVLEPCCAIQGGWMSIQSGHPDETDSCAFVWVNTYQGDPDHLLQWNGSAFVDGFENASFCLTGVAEERFGACCDDETGVCVDDVEMTQCPPPLRWAWNTLCVDLVPECGMTLGACCDDSDGTCVDNTPQMACPPPLRWTEATLCADLDPPCGGCSEDTLTINIMTDDYPSETTWDVVDVNTSMVIASGGPLADANTLHSYVVCIDFDGCYDFTVYDAYGDGICCTYGQGYYEVYLNSTLVGSNYAEWADGTHETVEVGNGCGPPPTGACCLEMVCVATNTEEECDGLGGQWYVGQTCPEFQCPEDLMTCPVAGTIYDQHPDPREADNAATSDLWWTYKVYDEVPIVGNVCDVHFWGIKAKPGAWVDCYDEPFTFEIAFYPDDGTGQPDIANPTCNYVMPIPAIDTGEMLFGAYQIYRWDAVLDPCCSIEGGWMSIQSGHPDDQDSCAFAWISTTNGNNSCVQWDGAGLVTQPYDVAFCLTGEAIDVQGACCDDVTGQCLDNTWNYDCPVEWRFAPYTLCADLVPPCGPILGACCVEGVCVATNTEEDCAGLLGQWFEGETCPEFECPAGPCDGAVYSNGLPDMTGNTSATQCDPVYPFAAGLADDFILPGVDPITITEVVTWTSHWNHDPLATPADYEGVMVTFYANNPDSTPNEPGGKPIDGDPDCNHTDLIAGGVIYSVEVPSGGFSYFEEVPGSDVWRLTLPVNVPLTGGVKYWLEVSPVFAYSAAGQSGHRPSLMQTGDFAAQIFEFLGTTEWTAQTFDVPFCLSAGVMVGACCDDYTGTCLDDVDSGDCPAGWRFVANTLCADLDPPCGILGACCVDDVCVATNLESECDQMGGTWYAGETCPEFYCPLVDCPDDAIFSQTPLGTNALTSDENPQLKRYDNYIVEEEICDIHFWGINGYFDGAAWSICEEEPMPFLIEFWADDGTGQPDLTGPVCTYDVTLTGTYAYDFGPDWPIYYYETDLDPCCALLDGWVSIQGMGDPNCWFLWINSDDGDMMSWLHHQDTDSLVVELSDLAFCLTPGGGSGDFPYLPGDANMYNRGWAPMVIGGDVTYLVNYFRGLPTSPPCPLPPDMFWCSADANGDCLVIGSDVTKLVNYFRGMGDPTFCPTYPPDWPTPGDLPPSAPAGWPPCNPPPPSGN
ncbi:MAG: hypothetical protein GY839_14610 [candidate division Zixibacteria bacterium]|nr:hypothetical protein [candidate division Zixibacteria bacterium]